MVQKTNRKFEEKYQIKKKKKVSIDMYIDKCLYSYSFQILIIYESLFSYQHFQHILKMNVVKKDKWWEWRWLVCSVQPFLGFTRQWETTFALLIHQWQRFSEFFSHSIFSVLKIWILLKQLTLFCVLPEHSIEILVNGYIYIQVNWF